MAKIIGVAVTHRLLLGAMAWWRAPKMHALAAWTRRWEPSGPPWNLPGVRDLYKSAIRAIHDLQARLWECMRRRNTACCAQ